MSQAFTHRLRELMQSVGFSSFRALSQAAGVSEKQILRLRQGDTQLRIETLLKLSHVLQVSVSELLSVLADPATQRSRVSDQQPESRNPGSANEAQMIELDEKLADLQHEYDRLQQQLVRQREELWQEFQRSSVQVLESLLLQLPTAAYAAQQNPQAPAIKLLPLFRPLDRLLEDWGVTSIATVGAEVPYDPQQHQLITGTAQPNDPVKVRYTGYRQGDRLLYRAKVSPIA